MSYYKFGDNFKWFVARISNIMDPEYLGRVQIRVLHDQTGELGKKKSTHGVVNEDLLWAWPLSGIQSSSLNWRKLTEENAGLEEFNTPDWIDAVGISPTGIAVGTYVFGFYLDAFEENIPIIFGTYHKMSIYPEPPSDDPNVTSMLQLEEPEEPKFHSDVAALARGFAIDEEGNRSSGQTLPKKYESGEIVTEPFTAYDVTYPYNLTYTTKSGHAIELDDTPGHERIHVWHKSGSYEEINEDGRRVVKTVNDSYNIVNKNHNEYIQGNWNLEIKGHAKILTKGGLSIAAPGGVTITDGSLYVEGSLGTKKGATGSFITLSGQIVTVQDGIVTNIY